ncbi:hypothetical protein C8D89_107149 [Actinomycetospora cinnamomea]|uniref:Uncharacterized protein n=1 Tax=Actinomycetospora cinnamomea TaxID=663609 RepID=A0A2U1F9W8_9PSEU|nr:hypothetical protein C8D89_107149 [Actinomycetospora cinnamomea]
MTPDITVTGTVSTGAPLTGTARHTPTREKQP